VCFILDYPIRIASTPRSADVSDIGGQGSFPLSFDLGADLFHAGLASKIVIFVPNRELYSSYLHQPLSIPPDAIIWARGKSNNTLWDLNGFQCDGFILLQFRHKMVIRTLHEYLGIIFYAVIGYI